MSNILALHHDLKTGTYHHGDYEHFKINDPKPRDIHKASVRDRLVHHALYRQLYPSFDHMFTTDSYSCRLNKGTHRAMNRFQYFASKVSKNNTHTCWVLKCDIRKFFASIDQQILINILKQHIPDQRTQALLQGVIESFCSVCATPGVAHRGLPLGNLTSQLLVNIYMNEFDRFAKHELKARYYIRYADDFVFLSQNREQLIALISHINNFLHDRLNLELHPDKVFIKTLSSGVDFLGWAHFHNHRVLRTSTKMKMLRRIKETDWKEETVRSYLGMLKHGNSFKLEQQIATSLTNGLTVLGIPTPEKM